MSSTLRMILQTSLCGAKISSDVVSVASHAASGSATDTTTSEGSSARSGKSLVDRYICRGCGEQTIGHYCLLHRRAVETILRQCLKAGPHGGETEDAQHVWQIFGRPAKKAREDCGAPALPAIEGNQVLGCRVLVAFIAAHPDCKKPKEQKFSGKTSPLSNYVHATGNRQSLDATKRWRNMDFEIFACQTQIYRKWPMEKALRKWREQEGNNSTDLDVAGPEESPLRLGTPSPHGSWPRSSTKSEREALKRSDCRSQPRTKICRTSRRHLSELGLTKASRSWLSRLTFVPQCPWGMGTRGCRR